MALDVNEVWEVFAGYLKDNFHKSKSLDAALMATVEFAYRKGLEDANRNPQNLLDKNTA